MRYNKILRYCQVPLLSSALAKQLDGTELRQGVKAKASGLRKGHIYIYIYIYIHTLCLAPRSAHLGSQLEKPGAEASRSQACFASAGPPSACGFHSEGPFGPGERRQGNPPPPPQTRLEKKGDRSSCVRGHGHAMPTQTLRNTQTQSGRNSLLVVLHRKMP